MLGRLAGDPQNMLKRLGDGYYEQRLVRDQLVNMTGVRYLDGFGNDEEQYRALMLSGVEFAEEFGLEIGMTLTAELMAKLTSDIVWLEYVTVDTPEGPVQALTPVVYLAPGREILLASGGGIVSGREVDIKGELNNAGNILGTERVSITGNDLNNSGAIAGGYVSMAALRDINNKGGVILGQTGVDLTAGRDINIESTTNTTSSGEGSQSSNRTDLGRRGVVMVTGETGSLTMNAGNDVNLKAATVASEGAATIAAGNDVNIGGVTLTYDHETGEKGKNYIFHRESLDVGSQVYASGNLNVSAGDDVAAVGSQVISDSAIGIQAGGNVSITEGRAQDFHESTTYEKSSGFLSNKTKKTHEIMSGDYAIGSEISGDTISIVAGDDVAVRGSIVSASEGLGIIAGGDIDISGADNYSEHLAESETKRSGFSASFSGSSVGVSYGKSKKRDESMDREHTTTGSLVGSVDGDVTLYAGQDVNIAGSQVVAGTGDITISGENVTIANQYETYDHWERHKFEQSGITLSLGLSGPVANAIQSGMQAADTFDRMQNTHTGRAQTLFGIAAARQTYDAGKEIVSLANGSQQPTQIGLSANIGYSSTKSESVYESHDQVAVSSLISSGGDITITARGCENETDIGDLAIIGSQVMADGRVMLDAANDLALLSAEENSSFSSSNKSSSSGFGVGVNIGINGGGAGIGLNADAHASKSKGNGEGQGTTHVETIIYGGEGVEFSSGKDTTLRGAQIIGEEVVGKVGGDLTIVSRDYS